MDDCALWSVDPLRKVFKDDLPPERPEKLVSMETARGALATGQFAVKSPDWETLTLEPFVLRKEGRGPEVTVTPRFVGFVLVNVNTPDTPIRPISRCPLSGEIDREAPCKFPDPLLECDTLRVEPGQTQPVWLTADIPPEQEPGAYRGELTLGTSGHTEKVPVALEVYPATVPSQRRLWVINHLRAEPLADFYHVEAWGAEHWEILAEYAKSMAVHRQNMINAPLFSLVKIIEEKDGLSFDFSLFDRFIEVFEKAGVAERIEGVTLAGSNRKTVTLNPLGGRPGLEVHTPQARAFLAAFLPALEKHLEDKGWLDKYLQRIFDEPRDEDAEQFRFLSSMVKELAPKLKRMEPILSVDLGDSLEVWIPALEHFEGGTGYDRYQNFFRELKAKGKEVWYYACFSPRGSYPNRFIDFPLLKQRYAHWINFKYDLGGFLHWGYNGSSRIWGRLYWNGRNEFCCGIQRECYAPGDAFVVYPGDRKPMSCLRYETHRKSIEDYELLRSLSERNPELAEDIAQSVLPSITGWERRIEKFNAAWRRLARA